MQIGDNLYIEVEIEEMGYKNFLTYSDVMDFKMVETAGASLPYIYMKIIIRDEKIKNAFQQNNIIKVTVGNNAGEADSFNVEIINVETPKDPSDTGWAVEFSGFLGAQSYMQELRTKAYWGNSLFVVSEIMQEYFGKKGKDISRVGAQSAITDAISNGNSVASLKSAITSATKSNEISTNKSLQDYFGEENLRELEASGNVSGGSEAGAALNKYLNTGKDSRNDNFIICEFSGTNENQVVWRQNNMTACSFVADTLLHADLRPSFPLFSFDRYLNFYIRDLSKMVKKGPEITFTATSKAASNEIQYFNSFNVESFKPTYNLYSGFNKITEIFDAVSGVPKNVIADNEPVLASTTESEKTEVGNTYSMNNVQSSNVHKNYMVAFAHNTNYLLSLSSMLGVLELHSKYYKNIYPTQLITVNTSEVDDPTLGGRYIVDTVLTTADFATGGFKTFVYVTRDNKNNVENYVPRNQKTNWLKVRKNLMESIVNAVSIAKHAYAQAMRIIDGRFLQEMLSFLLITKNNVLRSFRIAGVNIDFTSKENLLVSLIAEGNSLLNVLCDMIFPKEIADTLHNLIIMGRGQIGTLGDRVEDHPIISIISNYVDMYVPIEIRSIVMAVVESLCGITDSLNFIAKDNGISVTVKEGKIVTTPIEEDTTEETYVAEGQQRVDLILADFENNTTGLDVPFPIIELTESQSLYTDEELKNFVADETIAKLENLGYLDGVDINEFKEILIGEVPINFNIINQINESAGDEFNYRFWGTFTSLEELTSFKIRRSYKDKYRRLPCTKLISATDNQRIYFACPMWEGDLKFYINSRRVELNWYDMIDSGYKNIWGDRITYRVYYTEEGFNSNSVMFEVKQGGMV